MSMHKRVIQFSLDHPGTITKIMVIMTVLFGALLMRVQVETDPENMLPESELARLFHAQTTKEFSLHDVVILGVVNEGHRDGVFNPATLAKVMHLSRFAAQLTDPRDPHRKVAASQIIAPDTVEQIEHAGRGQVRFDWLMKEVPATRVQALKIRDQALANPLLKNTLVSGDGKALALYLPISTKDFSRDLSTALKAEIKKLGPGAEKFYLTGLPLAEDTFGREMFKQLALFAPLVLVTIAGLLLLVVRNVQLIIPPLIIALVTVIVTMGLVIGTGTPLHIMSSMIPLFIVPVALVNCGHILSGFYDKYQKILDRRRTIEQVMDTVFMPMFDASLISAAGFASLALTPIGPVQVFGIFVAFGIMLAWALTILFLPASLMRLKEHRLSEFGATRHEGLTGRSLLTRHLCWLGKSTARFPWLVLGCNIALLATSMIGISHIQVNDNPIAWFKSSHEIRRAERVLNSHFGGTSDAYLVLSGKDLVSSAQEAAQWLAAELQRQLAPREAIKEKALSELGEATALSTNETELAAYLRKMWQAERLGAATDRAKAEAWTVALDLLAGLQSRDQIFKRPDLLNYVAGLQNYLGQRGSVGKSHSLADLVKKINQELFEGEASHYTIPESVSGVSHALSFLRRSRKVEEVSHLVSPDYSRANLWLQLKSGDNKAMELVVTDVERYMAKNPPPVKLDHHWAGLTYLNMVWQEHMVSGMLKSLLTSLVVVFIMMLILLRSLLWGLLAMIPLTFTVGIIYGVSGLLGKSYDLPLAVLSALPLAITVNFTIHFLAHIRRAMKNQGDWFTVITEIFAQPARAISRNTFVIALGFTPLLFAPLAPYQTVGIFLVSSMLCSGLATIWLVPALITIMRRWLFHGAAAE